MRAEAADSEPIELAGQGRRLIDLATDQVRSSRNGLTALPEQLEDAPKSRRRRMRDRVGERKRWYDLPEETRHH